VVVKMYMDVNYDNMMDPRYERSRKQLLTAIQRQMAVVLSGGQSYDMHMDQVTVTFGLDHFFDFVVEVRMRHSNPSDLAGLIEGRKSHIEADVQIRIRREVPAIDELTGYWFSTARVTIFNVEAPIAATPIPPSVDPNSTAQYMTNRGVDIEMTIFNLPYDKVRYASHASKFALEQTIREVCASFLDFERSNESSVYSHRVDLTWQRGERPYQDAVIQASLKALEHEIPEKLKARIQMYQEVLTEDLPVKIWDVDDIRELVYDTRKGVKVEVVSVNAWERSSWMISAATEQANAPFTMMCILILSVLLTRSNRSDWIV